MSVPGEVTLYQTYESDYDKEREAKYVFPLEENCAGKQCSYWYPYK